MGEFSPGQIRDVTRERALEADKVADLHRILDGYDDMPVGLAVARGDGTAARERDLRADGLASRAGRSTRPEARPDAGRRPSSSPITPARALVSGLSSISN